MARNDSANGVFGLSVEMCVPADTEIPETCGYDTSGHTNAAATIATGAMLQIELLLISDT